MGQTTVNGANSQKHENRTSATSCFKRENGGSYWIRTSDQLVKSQSPNLEKTLINQLVESTHCPIPLFIHTVYKPLFLLVTASGMGQFFGSEPRNHNPNNYSLSTGAYPLFRVIRFIKLSVTYELYITRRSDQWKT